MENLYPSTVNEEARKEGFYYFYLDSAEKTVQIVRRYSNVQLWVSVAFKIKNPNSFRAYCRARGYRVSGMDPVIAQGTLRIEESALC